MFPDKPINTYTCTKGHITVTVDVCHGTTPMFLKCQQMAGASSCTEMARSAMYDGPAQCQVPEYEWYRPQNEHGMDAYDKEHYRLGGLFLRKIKK